MQTRCNLQHENKFKIDAKTIRKSIGPRGGRSLGGPGASYPTRNPLAFFKVVETPFKSFYFAYTKMSYNVPLKAQAPLDISGSLNDDRR